MIFRFFFRHNCNESFWKNIFLVSFHSCTSPLVCAPPQLTLSPSPTACVVDDIQRLRFYNSQSPNKFTGKPKIQSPDKFTGNPKTRINIYIYIAHHIRGQLHIQISHIRPSINRGFQSATDNDVILTTLLQHGEEKYSKLTVKNRSQKSVPNKW